MNIILIGFRGTGKTTIGRILAQRLDKEFIDADEFLEQKEGRTIKDIFGEGGEKLFREIEARIITELYLLDNKVIASGGGVILGEENVRRLKKNGILILLDADVDTIYKRISEDVVAQQRRPNLTNWDRYQEIEYLLEYRKPFYDKAADFVLNTASISAEEAVNRIVSFVRNYVKDLKNN
ncbi:MAG: shikimate kinase [Planctomycetota bacterium]